MNIETIHSYLCTEDTRHELARDLYDEDDELTPRKSRCGCDNCFYSRDPLAMELLKLHLAHDDFTVTWQNNNMRYELAFHDGNVVHVKINDELKLECDGESTQAVDKFIVRMNNLT